MDSGRQEYSRSLFAGEDMLQTIDERLHKEVRRVGKQEYHAFRCAGAFLFVYDTSGMLEPAVATTHQEYRDLHAVLPTYSESGEQGRSGIASVANEHGWARSIRPQLDKRIGKYAKKWQDSYGIHGSMMALKVCNCVDEPLGVVVVFADRYLDEDFPNALESFRWDLDSIKDLLQRRREASLQLALNQNSFLAEQLLEDSQRVRTVKGAAQHFAATMTPMLRLNEIFIAIADSQGGLQWLTPCEDGRSECVLALVGQLDFSDPRTFRVLNRREQAPKLWDGLQESCQTDRVWAAVAQTKMNRTIIFVANRNSVGLGDHWSDADIELVRRGCSFAFITLLRGVGVEGLLQKLASTEHEPTEFLLLCQMLKEYFGIDQVLVTHVTRTGSRYEIATKWPFGFDDNTCTMKSRPKHFPSFRSGRLDVMEYIVSDCLNDDAEDVYVATVGETDDRFVLDEILVDACRLRGTIYFVPCFTNGTREIAFLKSVLHLGRSDGTLTISDDCIPILQAIGKAFARWLQEEEDHRVSVHVKAIRDTGALSLETLQFICREVKASCGSLGCTLLLNIRYLKLVDPTLPDADSVEQLLKRFFVCCAENDWDELLGVRANLVRRMLSDFLGVRAEVVDSLAARMIDEISSLVSRSMYIHVTDDSQTSGWRKLFDLAVKRAKLSDVEICDGVTDVLSTLVYLPGFGLTGWVLRYRHAMLLRDKSDVELERFYSSVKDRIELPRVTNIIDSLDGAGALSETHLTQRTIAQPTHANHISEDATRRQTDDTYLAIPLKHVEILGFVPGVMRVSNSVTVKHMFDDRDEEVLEMAVRHVTNLLRAALMEQDAYRRDELVRRNYTDRVDHLLGKMKASVGVLTDVLRRNELGLSPDDARQLDKALSKLREISEVADGQQEIAILSAELRALPLLPHTLAEATNMLRNWLFTTEVKATVAAQRDDATVSVSGEDLITYWVVIEEVCRNARAHAMIERQEVVLSASEFERLEFLVCPRGMTSDAETPGIVWEAYSSLARGNDRGGGTDAIQNFCDRFDFLVQVGHLAAAEGLKPQFTRGIARQTVGAE